MLLSQGILMLLTPRALLLPSSKDEGFLEQQIFVLRENMFSY